MVCLILYFYFIPARFRLFNVLLRVENVKVNQHVMCRVDALGEDTNTDLGVEHRLKVSEQLHFPVRTYNDPQSVFRIPWICN
jgi:hypothetical protein